VLISGSGNIGAKAAFFTRIISLNLACGHSYPPKLWLETPKGSCKVNRIPWAASGEKAAVAVKFFSFMGLLPSPVTQQQQQELTQVQHIKLEMEKTSTCDMLGTPGDKISLS